MSLRYLHAMVRVSDLEESLDFYCNKLGLEVVRRKDVEEGCFTLVYLSAPLDKTRAADERAPLLELTYNWDPEGLWASPQLRPLGVRGRRYLRSLRPLAASGRHHQPAPARRQGRIRPLARQHYH